MICSHKPIGNSLFPIGLWEWPTFDNLAFGWDFFKKLGWFVKVHPLPPPSPYKNYFPTSKADFFYRNGVKEKMYFLPFT